MTDDTFRPTIYALHGCPFTMRAILFLDVAGLIDRFDIVGVERDTPQGDEIREHLAAHVEKVSFPTVEIAPGTYLADSGEIIAHYARESGFDPEKSQALRFYTETFMPKVGQLYRENMALKARAAG